MRTSTRLWGLSMLATLGLLAGACSNEDPSAEEEESSAGGSGEGPGPSVEAGAGGERSRGKGPSHECFDPVFHAESGTETCRTGSGDFYVHRKAVGTGCNYVPPESRGQGGAAGDEDSECFEDTDCSGRYPYCDQDVFGGSRCSEGCLTDDDCPTGQLCQCAGEEPGRCLAAGCKTDADCGDGFSCVAASDDCVGYESESTWYTCQQASDECLVDGDCVDAAARCELDGDRFRCLVPEGVCGRPLLVQGAARLAHVALRADWRAETTQVSDLRLLSAQERRELAQHYTQVALMEHASVAAFARFSLQLLALGAPPALVADCTRAIEDETRHARLCFELASRYAGFDVGPSALNLGGCLESCRLRDVLELVIIEGCVGETIAALEAAEAASHALDPAVCEVMSQIVDDERRHAELAYRFVAWALEQQPELAPLAERAFSEAARARRGTLPVPAAAPSPGLLDHGLLSTRQRHDVTRLALRDVIEPCARALLSRTPGTADRASLDPV